MNALAPYSKAIVAFITALLGSLVATGSDGWTSVEVLTAFLAGFVTLGATYAAPPNKDKNAASLDQNENVDLTGE